MLQHLDASSETTAELRAREPIFHCEPEGSDRAHFDSLLVSDYFEVGASGRVYDRDLVLDIVVDRYERDDPGVLNEVEDFRVREIAPDTFIATYTLHQPDGHASRVTRRSTVWTNASGRWQAVYHQGTIVDG
jgi:hypothetical protein